MEKIIWILNNKSRNRPGTNSRPEVNKLLQEGWKVKLMSSCAAGDYSGVSHVYVVLEK